MSQELSAWLRQQRQARSWPVPEMARRLRAAAKDTGDTAVPANDAMCRNIRRWESGHGGVSERYKLHYSKALGIPLMHFGPSQPQQPPDGPATTSATPRSPALLTGSPVPYLTAGPANWTASLPPMWLTVGCRNPIQAVPGSSERC